MAGKVIVVGVEMELSRGRFILAWRFFGCKERV